METLRDENEGVMIYIWDNGGAYSSHSVEFIEVTGDVDREQAEIVMTHERWDQPEIVAVVDVREWRDKYGPKNFWEWFGESDITENHDNLNDLGPIHVLWDWSKDRKWAMTLSPLASKLKLSFILRALDEWERRGNERARTATHHDAEGRQRIADYYKRLRRLIDLGIEHAVWGRAGG